MPVTFRTGPRTRNANRSHGGGQGTLIIGKGSAYAGEPIAEALRLLNLFARVGAEAFDITHTNLQQEKRGFRPAQSLAQARQSMPYLVPSAARRQNNLIVRPRAGDGVTLVQLDDLAPDALACIAPAAFLILRTSPRGQQAWVAVTNAPRGFAARLKEGTGADKEASGATRVAGTANFKPAYAPNFPRILIDVAQPGLRVTTQTLDAMGVVAPARPVPVASSAAVASSGGLRTRKWPSYARCLEGAPLGSGGSPKRTSADFIWCKIALSWGHGIEATAERLLEESVKARENGEAYARQTAEHADYAARQRNAQPRGRPARG